MTPFSRRLGETTRFILVAVGLTAAVGLLIALWPLLPALSIAAVLAYFLDPLVRVLMHRLKLSRPWAARLTFFLFLLALITVPALVGTLAVNRLDDLIAVVQATVGDLRQWMTRPIGLLGFRFQPEQFVETFESLLRDTLADLPGTSLNVLSSVTTNLLWGVVALVALYYFLKDGPALKPWLVGLAPPGQRAELRRLIEEVDAVWSRFLRVQLLMFFVLGFLMALGTLIVLLIFRSDIVPWSPLGFILSLILVYAALQQVDNLYMRPHLLGRRLHLHPGVAFVGMTGGLMLGGFLGALFAVPFLATLKVLGYYVRCKLSGQRPWPEEGEAEDTEEDEIPQQQEREEQALATGSPSRG
ncbi:MAG: AI-2E family transporter [Candidatus Promineifilaceae bacterium]|nr:AI-2E family transporter [Candidatus Promineifilaceae bacterium]